MSPYFWCSDFAFRRFLVTWLRHSVVAVASDLCSPPAGLPGLLLEPPLFPLLRGVGASSLEPLPRDGASEWVRWAVECMMGGDELALLLAHVAAQPLRSLLAAAAAVPAALLATLAGFLPMVVSTWTSLWPFPGQGWLLPAFALAAVLLGCWLLSLPVTSGWAAMVLAALPSSLGQLWPTVV